MTLPFSWKVGEDLILTIPKWLKMLIMSLLRSSFGTQLRITANGASLKTSKKLVLEI
jgi:hypothetical protein